MTIEAPTSSSAFPSQSWWQSVVNQANADIAGHTHTTAAIADLSTVVADASFAKPGITTATDLNTVYAPGVYNLGAPYPTGWTNTPLGNDTASKLVVLASPGSDWVAQEVYQYGATPRRWWRISRTTAGAWNPWQEIGSVDFPADSHALRVQAFQDAYPLVSTGGKGTVVLRFDHGLTNFKSTLWPILQARNVRAYIAMNSRTWAEAENSGATQADAQEWIATGKVEFGNHTADHNDHSTPGALYDAIVTGRKELESQLGVTIHGFTVPGVGGTALGGLGSGTVDNFSDTYAGGLILSHHGVTSGSVGNAQRPLDGVTRQGTKHITWEALTWTAIKGHIDTAAASGTALTLMMHPRNLNEPGFVTTALADQTITYIRSLIDAGTLADVSYYQSHHATTEALVGGVGPTGPAGGSDAAAATWINSGPLTQAAGDGRWAKVVDISVAPGTGSFTSGSLVKVGAYAYVNRSDVNMGWVAGGGTNNENVIGGNTANVNTATSNLTGAPTLTGTDGQWDFILSGYDNVVNGWACVVNGFHNYVKAGGNHATISGGSIHAAGNANYMVIGGGTGHTINDGASGGTIGGGISNTIAASATSTTIAGGNGNTASRMRATVGGGNVNTASGNGSTVAGGDTNTASGAQSAVPGGLSNTASGAWSVATGSGAVAASNGMRSHGSQFATPGDAQSSRVDLKAELTTATQTTLSLHGSGGLVIPVDTTWAVSALVVARRTDADDENAAWRVECVVKRNAGSTTALVGTPIVTALGANAGNTWAVTVTTSTAGNVNIRVTGEAAKTIRWFAALTIAHISG